MNHREHAAGLAKTPGYRYADAVDDQLFIAGQVPLDRDGRLVAPDDRRAQAVQCLDNLQTLIELHGFALPDVRRLIVYVVGDHHQLSEAWSAVREWFEGEVPPATLLGVALLGHPGQLVEIDATVVRRSAASPGPTEAAAR